MVELLIVVVIIGLMAAAAMPRISRVVADERIRKLQAAVATDIERGFALAMRQHKPVAITFNAATSVLSITDRGSNTVLYSNYIGRSGELSTTAVTFQPSGGITVFPMGLADSALTIRFTNATFTRTISATRAGLVTKS